MSLVTTNSFLTRTGGLGDIEVAIKHALYPPAAMPNRLARPGGGAADRRSFQRSWHGRHAFRAVLRGDDVSRLVSADAVKAEFPIDSLRASRAHWSTTLPGRDTSAAPNTLDVRRGVERRETRSSSPHPARRKGLTGTGALAASVGMMVPLNKREEQGVRWVGHSLWEYLEPWRARR